MPTVFFQVRFTPPADLSAYSDVIKRRFWTWVRDLSLQRKDWELAMGYNARGRKMPPVYPETRWNRRTVSTPDGRGDPYAPYLQPGRKGSRTRSLLTGKGETNRAILWWKWDKHSRDEWGVILEYHRRRGSQYDVIGLSPKGVAWVKAKALERWRREKPKKAPTGTKTQKAAMPKAKPAPKPKPPEAASPPQPPPVSPLIDVKGRISQADVAKATQLLNSLPEHVRRKIEEAGGRVVLAETMADVMTPEELAVKPRGWPEGATWANVDGAYMSGRKHAVVCDKPKNLATGEMQTSLNFFRVLMHEVGHQIDHLFGDLARSPEFRRRYEDDVRGLGADELATYRYYVQSGDAGAEEAFAEIVAAITTGSASGLPMTEKFSGSTDYMRKFFERPGS